MFPLTLYQHCEKFIETIAKDDRTSSEQVRQYVTIYRDHTIASSGAALTQVAVLQLLIAMPV